MDVQRTLVAYIPSVPSEQRQKRLQGLKINSPHPRANPCNNFPGNRPGSLAQLSAGNLFASITPHQNNIVANLRIIDSADIDHHQVHCDSAEKRTTFPVYQNGGATIRKMPRITIGVSR